MVNPTIVIVGDKNFSEYHAMPKGGEMLTKVPNPEDYLVRIYPHPDEATSGVSIERHLVVEDLIDDVKQHFLIATEPNSSESDRTTYFRITGDYINNLWYELNKPKVANIEGLTQKENKVLDDVIEDGLRLISNWKATKEFDSNACEKYKRTLEEGQKVAAKLTGASR